MKNRVDLPIIAAGGISTPEHVRQFLNAGADAVQVGTAYLCCHEAKTSNVHRELLKRTGARRNSAHQPVFRAPGPGYQQSVDVEELGPLSDVVPAFPLASAALAPLRAAAEAQGRGDFFTAVVRNRRHRLPGGERRRTDPVAVDVLRQRRNRLTLQRSGAAWAREALAAYVSSGRERFRPRRWIPRGPVNGSWLPG